MAEQRSDVHVEFYSEAVQNPGKSKEAGRPIFEDKEFVRIKFPGDKQRVHVAPANERSLRDPQDNTNWLTYIDRFPAHYEAFKKNEQYRGEGTPVDEAPFLSNAQKAELKAANVFTLEALAGLPHSAIPKLGMNARTMVNQAQAYLDKATGSAVETRMAAENAELRDQMAALQRQVTALVGAVPAPGPQNAGADFDAWSDEDLKAYIKDATGSGPRGNPSHETLVKMADEASSRVAA